VPVAGFDRETYWSSIADWLRAQVSDWAPGRALVVGLSAPQGAGKTTLTREVVARLGEQDIRAAAVSIDDFYLTRSDQAALASLFPDNLYLQHRGLPGTHDIELGVRTIRALRDTQTPVRVPRYDKTQFSGQGDRMPEAEWPTVAGPLDLVVLEGWMLGFVPVPDAELGDRAFARVNRELANYSRWWDFLDGFIWIEPDDISHVRRWRAEAEAAAIAAGKPGMDAEEVQDFVTPFFTAYAAYLPGLRESQTSAVRFLQIVIGADRLPKVGSC
jgi:D-glycerate 3-kinase